MMRILLPSPKFGLFILGSIILLFAGCNGCDDDDDDGDDRPGAAKVSGVVLDPYIKGARVWCDLNDNGFFDSSTEPSTITNERGLFTFDSGECSNKTIILDGIDGTVHVDENGDVIAPFTGRMKAPSGSKFVTPLTSLTQTLIESGETAADAQKKVAKALGLPSNVADFGSLDINDKANSSALKAAVVAQQLILSTTSAMQGVSGAPITPAAFESVTDAIADVIKKSSAPIIKADGGVDPVVVTQTLQMTVETVVKVNKSYTGFDAANITSVISGAVANSVQQVAAIADKAASKSEFITAAALTQTQGTGVAVIRVSMDTLKGYFDGSGDFDKDGTADIAQGTAKEVAAELIGVLDAVAIGLAEAVTTEAAGLVDENTSDAELKSVIANVIQETVGKALEDKGLQDIAARVVENTVAAVNNGSTTGLGDTSENHPPKVQNSALTVRQGQTNSVTLKVHDIDEGDTLVFGDPSPGENASVTPTTGVLSFNAEQAEIGNTTVTFDVSDGKETVTGTVVVSVVPNSPPVALDVDVTMRAGETLTGTFPIVNFEGDPLIIALISTPSDNENMVVVSGDQYTINTTGVTNQVWTFTYKVDDGSGGIDFGNLNIDLQALNANNPPVAFNSTVKIVKKSIGSGTLEATIGSGTLEATDADVNDTLIFSDSSDALDLEPRTGKFTFDTAEFTAGSHDIGFTVSDGTDTDSATLTIIVKEEGNEAPVARNVSLRVIEGASADVTLIATDADAGDTLTFTLTADPVVGGATISDTTLTFNAFPSVGAGVYSVGFTVTDKAGAVDTGRVAISVVPLNLPPIARSVAMTFDIKVLAGNLAEGKFKAVDRGNTGTLTYRITKNVDGNYAVLTNESTGAFTLDAVSAGVGTHIIEFKVNDSKVDSVTGTVTVVVTNTSENAPPTTTDNTLEVELGFSANGQFAASDPDENTTLTYLIKGGDAGTRVALAADGGSTGNFTFDSTGDAEAGIYTVIFSVTDGEFTSTGTVTVNVVDNNSPPTVTDGTLEVIINQAVPGTFTATDPDNDTLTFSVTGISGDGTVILINPTSGQFTFTAGNTTGAQTVTFSVTDSQPANAAVTGSVVVTVLGSDNTPVPDTTSLTFSPGIVSNSGTIAAATDADGDALTYSGATDPVNSDNSVTLTGTVVLSANGVFTFDTSSVTAGEYTFTYIVSDGGSSATGTVTLIVGTPPVATDGKSFTVITGQTLSGTLEATDADGAGTFTFSEVTDTENVTTIESSGNFTFDATSLAPTDYTFEFKVEDNQGLSDTSTITVTVQAIPNNAPVAQDGLLFVPVGGSNNSILQAADTDGGTLTFTVTTQPTAGAVTVNDESTGAYTFDASSIESAGSFTFGFTVSDGTDTDTGTVTVTVGEFMKATEISLNSVAAVSVSEFVDSGVTIDLPLGLFSFKVQPGGFVSSALRVKLGLTIENDANDDVIHVIVDAVDLTVNSTGQIIATAPVGLKAYIDAFIGTIVVRTSVQNSDLNLVEATPAGVATMLTINLGRIISRIPVNDPTVDTTGWPLVDPTVTGDFTTTAVIVVKKADDQVVQVIDVNNDPLEPEKTVTVQTVTDPQTVTGNAVTGTVTLTTP